MKINVLFFANFRELLDCSNVSVEIEEETSIATLCQMLAAKGERWQNVFENASKSVKIAVNQEMADFNQVLQENDEVAFFPPVTGG